MSEMKFSDGLQSGMMSFAITFGVFTKTESVITDSVLVSTLLSEQDVNVRSMNILNMFFIQRFVGWLPITCFIALKLSDLYSQFWVAKSIKQRVF